MIWIMHSKVCIFIATIKIDDMKKLFFALTLLYAGLSCESNQIANRPNFSMSTVVANYHGDECTFDVIQIDSCEYLMHNVGYNTGVMTHKGNCKNPVHK